MCMHIALHDHGSGYIATLRGVTLGTRLMKGNLGMRGFVVGSMLALAVASGALAEDARNVNVVNETGYGIKFLGFNNPGDDDWTLAEDQRNVNIVNATGYGIAPLTIASVSIEPRTKPLIPTLPSSDCCPRRPAIALYPRSPFPARKQVVTTPTIPIKKAL